MKKVVSVIALALVLGGAGIGWGEEQHVAGTWTGTITGRAGNRETKASFELVLAQDGQNVTGTYSSKVETGGRGGGRGFDKTPVNGTVTGNPLSLTWGGNRVLTATVAGDLMSGSVAAADSAPSSVSATRSK
jgi:hypothetical protein